MKTIVAEKSKIYDFSWVSSLLWVKAFHLYLSFYSKSLNLGVMIWKIEVYHKKCVSNERHVLKRIFSDVSNTRQCVKFFSYYFDYNKIDSALMIT
jgi:hypothetical protein